MGNDCISLKLLGFAGIFTERSQTFGKQNSDSSPKLPVIIAVWAKPKNMAQIIFRIFSCLDSRQSLRKIFI
jgi:hypothetical protein